ncbi:MAG: nucleotide exchange factor GrpE [Candidatus Saccharimonadales bacterium]
MSSNSSKSDHNDGSLKNNEAPSTPDKHTTKQSVTGRIKNVIDERKKLESKVSDLTDALQRERADITNIRRRHEGQMTSLRDVVKAGVIRDLLPAIDNLERGLKHVPKDIADHDYVKGIQGIVKQFEKTLKDIGVERVKTVGKEFDPKYHEAISMEDGDGSREVVCEELQSGYTLGDEVIRHAMVKVKTEK